MQLLCLLKRSFGTVERAQLLQRNFLKIAVQLLNSLLACRSAIRFAHPQITSDAKRFSPAMQKPISSIWNHRKRATKAPGKILRCWSAMHAKCLRFGLSLQFGLWCQIASDVGRAMWTTKVMTIQFESANFIVEILLSLRRLLVTWWGFKEVGL